MLDDPGLDGDRLRRALRDHYGVDAAGVRFLPLGYDYAAAVYEVAARGGRFFLKVRFGPPNLAALAAAAALRAHGIPEVLAPLPTTGGAWWCADEDLALVLYPWIDGRDAATAGMSAGQWRTFGRALRAVHDAGLAARFRGRLRTEAFDLPAAALVRAVDEAVAAGAIDPEGLRWTAMWRANRERIAAALRRAEELGAVLRARPRAEVLCHGDIHQANVLVGDDGRVHLIDWDGPLLAPRERDLLFVVGAAIARRVLPEEEAAFFGGYGPVAIDRDALVYFRYERLLEDLGEFGRSVLLDPATGDAGRREAVDIVAAFFAPGGDLDRVEAVSPPAFDAG
jgi:spectinomycin phosphotransferase